ncbi:hypothetical protein ACLF6K_36785 [Streptomyces xanthophaeus]|uniref:hypothetical protein n=1 Tax=Streptomyces xanthophaeus TaxID=67385 RepID=UPI00399004A0
MENSTATSPPDPSNDPAENPKSFPNFTHSALRPLGQRPQRRVARPYATAA